VHSVSVTENKMSVTYVKLCW